MILKASFAVVVLACVSCGGSTLGGAGGSGGSDAGGTTGVAGTSAGGSGGVGGTIAGGSGGVGGTSAGGTTGVAGTSAGGTTGGGASGGTGGAPKAEENLPRCLADLVAPCTCKGPSACGPQSCFAPGVTRTTTRPDGGSCNFTGDADEIKVYKAGGTLCYSVQSSGRPDMACEVLTIVWRDAAGQEVASAHGYPSFGTCATLAPPVTCKATGETGIVPLTWPPADCPAGTCQ